MVSLFILKHALVNTCPVQHLSLITCTILLPATLPITGCCQSLPQPAADADADADVHWLQVWEGNGVVASARKIIGATNPLAAEPGTIRGDYAIEVGRNVVHGSDSTENGEREAGGWRGLVLALPVMALLLLLLLTRFHGCSLMCWVECSDVLACSRGVEHVRSNLWWPCI